MLEMSILTDEYETYSIVLSMLYFVTLILVSYNQLELMIACLIGLVYSSLRSYFWVGLKSWLTLFLSSIFFLVIGVIISRLNVRKERTHYFNLQYQSSVINMLHNIIKAFHDGIIILEGPEIIYYNQQST